MLNFLFKFNFILSVFSSFIVVNLNYNLCYGAQDDGRPSSAEPPGQSLPRAYPAVRHPVFVPPENTVRAPDNESLGAQRLGPRGVTDGHRTWGEKVADYIEFAPQILAAQEALRGPENTLWQRFWGRLDVSLGRLNVSLGVAGAKKVMAVLNFKNRLWPPEPLPERSIPIYIRVSKRGQVGAGYDERGRRVFDNTAMVHSFYGVHWWELLPGSEGWMTEDHDVALGAYPQGEYTAYGYGSDFGQRWRGETALVQSGYGREDPSGRHGLELTVVGSVPDGEVTGPLPPNLPPSRTLLTNQNLPSGGGVGSTGDTGRPAGPSETETANTHPDLPPIADVFKGSLPGGDLTTPLEVGNAPGIQPYTGAVDDTTSTEQTGARPVRRDTLGFGMSPAAVGDEPHGGTVAGTVPEQEEFQLKAAGLVRQASAADETYGSVGEGEGKVEEEKVIGVVR